MLDKNDVLNILNSNYEIAFTDAEFHREGGSISFTATSDEAKYFFRVIRPELFKLANQSIEIHLYLQSNNFPVPSIILTSEGKPYFMNVGEDENNMCILYEFLEGGETTAEDVSAVGELVGKLHLLMKDFKGELKHQDRYFFIDRYIEILSNKNYPRVDEYKAIGDMLWERVKDLPRGYCHCDLYPGNVYKSKEGALYLLDLDTSCVSFPMYDVTLFCNETNYFEYTDEGFERSKVRLSCFLEGYLKYCTLTDAELKAFYYLHPIYHFQLQAIIVEIYGVDCNDEHFEDNQLDWIGGWLKRAKLELGYNG